MEFSDFIIYKALALIAIVAVVHFVYALVTGQTIEEARRDKHRDQSDSESH